MTSYKWKKGRSYKRDRAPHLVITVHGIRTFGQWQERLEALVAEEAKHPVEFVNYKFGYFSVIAFMTPLFRWLVVRRFRDTLIAMATQKAWGRIDLVGHSFGTHIIGWTIAKLPKNVNVPIHTVILAGSVLKSRFRWQYIIGARVVRVVNDCGAKDRILILSQLLILFTGMAGRTGFFGATSSAFRNRYNAFGHSGYFQNESGISSNEYMKEHWVPLISESAPVSLFDLRNPGRFDGFVEVFANNAEPLKLILYATPIAMLLSFIYGFYADALLNESRFMARVASDLTSGGNPGTATEVLLKVVPDRHLPFYNLDRYRPLSVEAEASLYSAVMQYRQEKLLMGHTSPVERVQFSKDGTRAITASGDGTLLLWDLGENLISSVLAGSADEVPFILALRDAAISPDGQFIARSVWRQPIRLWDVSSGEEMPSLEGSTDPESNLVFSSDSSLIASTFDGGKPKIWRLRDGKELLLPQPDGEEVITIVFSNKSDEVLTGTRGGVVRIFDAATGAEVSQLKGHLDSVFWARYSPDDQTIATASTDKTVRIWNSKSGAQLKSFDQPVGMRCFDFSPDGTQMMIASLDGKVRFWGLPSFDLVAVPEQWHGDEVNSATYSPDGSLALTVSTDKTARIWDTRTGKSIETISGAPGYLMAGAFSRDGKKILIGGDKGWVTIRDVRGAGSLEKLVGHGDSLTTVAISRDNNYALSASWDKTVRVWDLMTSKEIRRINASQKGPIIGAFFSTDGTQILSSSYEDVAKLWNVASGALIGTFEGQGSAELPARFSPDGVLVATLESYRGIKLWDSKVGKLLYELKPDMETSGELSAFSFSPDSRWEATGDELGVTLWQITLGKPPADFARSDRLNRRSLR